MTLKELIFLKHNFFYCLSFYQTNRKIEQDQQQHQEYKNVEARAA